MAGIDADLYFDYDDKVMSPTRGTVARAREARLAAVIAAGQGAERVARVMAERDEMIRADPYALLPDDLKGMPLDAWWAIEGARDAAKAAWQQVAAACEPLREISRQAWSASEKAWLVVQEAEGFVWWPLRTKEGAVWGSGESDACWRQVLASTDEAVEAWLKLERAAQELLAAAYDPLQDIRAETRVTPDCGGIP